MDGPFAFVVEVAVVAFFFFSRSLRRLLVAISLFVE